MVMQGRPEERQVAVGAEQQPQQESGPSQEAAVVEL